MSFDDDIEARPQREAPTFTSVLMRHTDSLAVAATTLILSLSLYVHFGVVFPIVYPKEIMNKRHPSKVNFNWETCNSEDSMKLALAHGDDCPCWDGLFKGSYSINGRHAVFFNIQRESLSIFALTCVFICISFVALKKLIEMILCKRLRLSAFLIIVCNAHAMYYHWWCTFSYLNESWYRYYWSQWVFGITEGAVMYVLLLRIDNQFKIQSAHAVTVISIAIFHMSQGIVTQVIHNILQGEIHLIARDMGFMSGELFCVAAVLYDMRQQARQCGRPLLRLYPHFATKIVFMIALMWSVLSTTTFTEMH